MSNTTMLNLIWESTHPIKGTTYVIVGDGTVSGLVDTVSNSFILNVEYDKVNIYKSLVLFEKTEEYPIKSAVFNRIDNSIMPIDSVKKSSMTFSNLKCISFEDGWLLAVRVEDGSTLFNGKTISVYKPAMPQDTDIALGVIDSQGNYILLTKDGGITTPNEHITRTYKSIFRDDRLQQGRIIGIEKISNKAFMVNSYGLAEYKTTVEIQAQNLRKQLGGEVHGGLSK